jgi:hypothetical protein
MMQLQPKTLVRFLFTAAALSSSDLQTVSDLLLQKFSVEGPAACRTEPTENFVRSCGRSKSFRNHVSVRGSLSEPCDGKTKLSNRIQYQLSRKSGEIHLTSRIYFTYRDSPERKPQILQRLEKGKSCMTRFFDRHGIKLNIEFFVDSGWADWAKSDFSVNLWDYRWRRSPMERIVSSASSTDWTSSPNAENWTTAGMDESQCTVFLHEFGHTLGLTDTYQDRGRCPARETIMPANDIMSNATMKMDEQRLYPDAIRKILKPLCDP